MDLKEALLREHSKRQTQSISDFIGNHQSRFDALMQIFFTEDYRVVQRAAWVLSYSAMAHPILVQKHLGSLIHHLEQGKLHETVKRNTLKVFQEVEVPEEWLGALAGICFNFLYHPTEAIATKAYSINILVKICEKHPELKAELLPLLKELINHDSPAILSCSKRGLKYLEKSLVDKRKDRVRKFIL